MCEYAPNGSGSDFIKNWKVVPPPPDRQRAEMIGGTGMPPGQIFCIERITTLEQEYFKIRAKEPRELAADWLEKKLVLEPDGSALAASFALITGSSVSWRFWLEDGKLRAEGTDDTPVLNRDGLVGESTGTWEAQEETG